MPDCDPRRRPRRVLPTFVIGLREGLEATLIVVIIATFLSSAGRRDSLRAMWTGVAVAVLFCIGFGIALQILDENLPQIRQEQLETLVALVAAAAVTYMIVWMRRHARDLRGDLQDWLRGRSAARLRQGTGRDGVLRGHPRRARDGRVPHAAFQQSARPALTGSGAILGIFAAVCSAPASTAAASRSTSFAFSGSPASSSFSSRAA